MMESSNLNIDLFHHHHHHSHHHQEEEFHGSSSSSSFGGAAPPPFHFMGKEPHDQWNQHDSNLVPLSSCGSDFTPSSSTGILTASSRDFVRGSHEMSMGTQDLGFLHWAPSVLNGGEGYMNMMNCNHASPPSPHHQAAAIKEELSSDSMITAKLLLQDYHHHLLPSHDQLMHETNNYQIHNTFDLLRFAAAGGSVAAVANFNTVLPTTNIPSSTSSSSLSMDLVGSNRFCRTMLPQPSPNNMVFLREDAAYGGTIIGRQLQQQQPPPEAQPVVSSSSHHKASNSASAVTEGKRSNTVDSTTPQLIAKKPRFESRSSCSTPFKVRKEKLGDRIAALQQLVAPFGKTDTASVLMEAIGYIKFLQDQVETLSVPYMRSSSNKTLRSSQGASNEGKDEPKPDLRSRGLCLVPLSCTSYVTNENGGVWFPPNYRGGT